MSTIKTAIICDPFVPDVDAEYAQIKERLDYMNLPIEIMVRGTGMHVLKDQNIDLVIMDYGGMSYGSRDTGVWQVKFLCEWARDHPNGLVVMWTYYTQELYDNEVAEQFEGIANIIPYTEDGESLSPRIRTHFAGRL